MDPAFPAPGREGLTGINAEIVERAVATRWREPGLREPVRREFLATIRHVLAAEYAECKHFPRRKLRAKFGFEIAPDRRSRQRRVARIVI
jgi:hypothetical protein